MDYSHLGRTGLRVSRIALGTMTFGELTDEPASFAIMDAALEVGIDFFDTADVYGGPLAEGALAWQLAQPRRHLGDHRARTAEQLRQNLKAPSVTLSDEVLAKLDTIWPGTGGEAPEARAW